MGVAALIVLLRLIGDLEGDWRPSHFDEWRSLAQAQRLVSTGELVRVDRVGSFDGLARDISDRNRSLGFVAIYGAWLRLAPDPIRNLKWMAGIFVVFYVLGAAALLAELGVRPVARLPALLGIGSIVTDPEWLGPALAVPSSLSMGLLALNVFAHVRLTRKSSTGTRSGRQRLPWIVLIGFSSAALAVVYPLTLIVFFALFALDVGVRLRFQRDGYVHTLLGIGCAGAIGFVVMEWQGSLAETVDALVHLTVLDKSWHLAFALDYRIDYVVLPATLLLALYGAGVSISRLVDRDSSDELESPVWGVSIFLAALAAFWGYLSIGYGLVVPYQRLGLYLNFGAVLCAGIAVEHLLRLADERWRPRWSVHVSIVLVLALAVSLTPRASPPIPGRSKAMSLHPPAELEEVARRLTEAYPTGTTFFAEPLFTLYLEGLTGFHGSHESLDFLLTGSNPPAVDCRGDRDLLIGAYACDRYAKAFGVRSITVLARTSPVPRDDVESHERID